MRRVSSLFSMICQLLPMVKLEFLRCIKIFQPNEILNICWGPLQAKSVSCRAWGEGGGGGDSHSGVHHQWTGGGAAEKRSQQINYFSPQGQRMAWVKSDSQVILAIGSHIIKTDQRFAVSHDEDTWRFHIRPTRIEDSGTYLCQETCPLRISYHLIWHILQRFLRLSAQSGL